MNITVCIKRTPDTETRVRIDADGTSIDAGGVKYIISPYDEFAIEAALRLRDAGDTGEVTLLSLGAAAASEQLRGGLAMGADRAVLLEGRSEMDAFATARTLADELAEHDAPLVLFGVKAADDDQQQVGPMVATFLDRPCVTAVGAFTLDGDIARCRREVDGGTEIVEVTLPAVLTITKGEFEPRYASLKGIMAAKRKPLDQKEVEVPPSQITVEALELPPARPEGRIVGEGPEAATELVRLLREEARVL